MATPAAALPVVEGGSARHERTTPLIAVIALAALALLPWGAEVGATALGLIVAQAKWPQFAAVAALGPLVGATLVLAVGAGRGWTRLAAATAGFARAWACGQGCGAGSSGPA